MLEADQVKPLLSHADRFIRNAAADYFTESCSPDPDVLPLAYFAHSRFIVRIPVRGTRYPFLLSNGDDSNPLPRPLPREREKLTKCRAPRRTGPSKCRTGRGR